MNPDDAPSTLTRESIYQTIANCSKVLDGQNAPTEPKYTLRLIPSLCVPKLMRKSYCDLLRMWPTPNQTGKTALQEFRIVQECGVKIIKPEAFEALLPNEETHEQRQTSGTDPVQAPTECARSLCADFGGR